MDKLLTNGGGNMPITVEEFLGHIWYTSNVAIVDYMDFDSLWNTESTLKDKSLLYGINYKIRECLSSDLRCAKVQGAGVVDNILVIEVVT